MPGFNFHTHSHYCDGSSHPEDYVRAAMTAGFHSLGFSSHAPVPFSNSFAIKDNESLIEYCHTVRKLGKIFGDALNIYLSLEIDYIPGLMPGFDELRKGCGLDYVIGSVHLVRREGTDKLWFIDGPKQEIYDQGLQESFDGDIRKGIASYYHQIIDMVETQRPDIVGHLDKVKMHNRNRYFSEEEGWYAGLVGETLEVIRSAGTIVEVNTRGVYKKRSDALFPGVAVLKRVLEMAIPVTLSSDAHKPEEIDGYYPEAVELLKGIGFRKLMVFNGEGWESRKF